VIAGTTYFFTRRCVQRQFLLKPTEQLVEVFAFCLAVASSRTGVVLHAFTVMSNHWHAVLTDVEGRLPEFAEWVHKYVAKCMNCALDRRENFWSSVHYNAIALTDREDVLDKIAYTLANPVSARLVPCARGWPGLRSEPESHMTPPVPIDRPRVYFRKNGEVTERAFLMIEKPSMFADVKDETYAELVGVELERREVEQRRRVARRGGGFVGLRKIRETSPFSVASAPEAKAGPVPRVASRSRRRRLEGIKRLKSFLTRYREALERYRRGDADVVFPEGTYWMRRFLGVICVEP
jgi:REP element-mobilizing transposase RayT